MESIKQSCLRWIVFYAILVLLLSAVVYLRFPNPGAALGIGFVASFMLFMGVAYLISIGTRTAEKRIIRRGIHGERPADGETIAVLGRISSSFESLEVPISRRRCVAYEYKAFIGENEAAATYHGFQLLPLAIEGPRGSIRLLAAPELAFPEQKFTRIEHYDNFREYITRTQFIKRVGFDFKATLEHLKSILADDDGRIHYDIHNVMVNHPEYTEDVTQMRLTEKILESGEPICAIGRYSAARNALVPDARAMMHPVKILKGEPHEVAGKVKGSSIFDAILSCGCLLPLILGALIGLAVVPLDAIEQMFPKKDPSWKEVEVERWVKREVLPRLPANMKSDGQVAIDLNRGAARGKLTSGETTIPLVHASALRDGDIVELTLAPDGEPASGIVATFGAGHRLTSLRILNGPPLQAASAEVENLAISDEGITGRIIYLSPEHKLRVMFSSVLKDGELQ